MSTRKEQATTASTFARMQGTWRSQGYGWLLEIGPDGYVMYEETSVSCLPIFSGTLEELAKHYPRLRRSPGGRSFRVRRATGVSWVGFRSIGGLPDVCAETADRDPEDIRYNFDVFRHTLAEQYALFDVKNVDWQAACDRLQHRFTPDLSAAEFFTLLTDLLRPLRDGHIHLHTPHDDFSAASPPPVCRRLTEELQEAEDWQDTLSYLAELRAWLRETIRESYLDGQSRQAGHRLLEWGRLDGETGYLAIRAMAGLCGRIGRPIEDLAVVDQAMSQCLQELDNPARLVLDLRGNGGGYDGVALRLAGYFLDRRRLAFTKRTRCGDGFTGAQRVCAEPSTDSPYTGELLLLTSGLTASAAEIFVLALLARPGVTRIGEPTQGILSDTLERHLPNGWWMTLSNEIYLACDDTFYEDCGIPPDIEIPYLDAAGRAEGRDPMLDRALQGSA